jgi:hypothetical protein
MEMTAFDLCLLGMIVFLAVLVRWQMHKIAVSLANNEILVSQLAQMLVDVIEDGSALEQMRKMVIETKKAKLKLKETTDDDFEPRTN